MTLARRVQGMEQVVALAEAGSFVAAGRRLGVSPSALGKAIAATEERLDARLFHRTTRSVALTEEGALYLDHCRRVLSEVDDAEAALARSAEGVAGTIRLGAPSAYGRLRIVPPLARFLAAHPEARVDLRLADRVLDPLEERLDLVVRIGRLADSGMRAWEIDHVRIGLLAHPDRLAIAPIDTPADLAAHPLLLFETPDGRPLRPSVRDEADHLLNVPPALVSTDAEAVVAAAEAGGRGVFRADLPRRSGGGARNPRRRPARPCRRSRPRPHPRPKTRSNTAARAGAGPVPAGGGVNENSCGRMPDATLEVRYRPQSGHPMSRDGWLLSSSC